MNFSQLGLVLMLIVVSKLPQKPLVYTELAYNDPLGREVEALIKEDVFYSAASITPVTAKPKPISALPRVDVLVRDNFPDSVRMAYVRQWWEVAVAQRKAHGIPAAVALAQGILESNAGRSNLARNTNNHFGIKCWLWKKGECGKGHCFQYHDDHPTDRFRTYSDVAGSWEDHSRFLLRPNYESCFEIPYTDYKGWTACLKRRGYATDPAYARKLNRIIKDYKLHQFDNL